MSEKAAMAEAEFQAKVLGGVEAQHKKLEAVTEDIGRLDKETKATLEEVTKLKNHGGRIDEVHLALKKLQLQLAREKSNALSNPLQRIMADDEKKARLAGAILLAAGRQGGREFEANAQKLISNIIGKAEGEDSGFGASLITPDLSREIYDSLAIYGAWNTLAVRRLGTKVTEFPVKTARAQANWITSEGAAIVEDSAKAGTSVTATVRPIGVLLSVSQQLLEDSPLDVVADVMDDFVEGFAQCLDTAAFIGNGTTDATNGGYTGIFNAGTASVAASTHTTVGAMNLQDVLNVLTSVDSVVLQRNARWWMHPFQLANMIGIKDTTGRPLFQSILERPAPNAVGTLLGYPVSLVSVAPYANAASSQIAAFGDPNSGVVGIREDFKFEYSDDYHFNTYQRSFRGIGRGTFAVRKATAFSVLETAAS